MSNLRLLDPVFGDSFENTLRRFLAPIALETEPAALKMRLDVTENEQAYQVTADLPGVSKEDIPAAKWRAACESGCVKSRRPD